MEDGAIVAVHMQKKNLLHLDLPTTWGKPKNLCLGWIKLEVSFGTLIDSSIIIFLNDAGIALFLILYIRYYCKVFICILQANFSLSAEFTRG